MTAQVYERLILKGKTMGMAACPSLPENDPRIVRLTKQEMQGVGMIFFSTACWRQYIGTWALKDKHFYLVALEGVYRMSSEAPILADWFTGTLRIPQAKILASVDAGFGSEYERDIYLDIENGRLMGSRTEHHGNQGDECTFL